MHLCNPPVGFPKAIGCDNCAFFLFAFSLLIVSGKEKTRKPFRKIYKLALDRYDMDPSETLFIDDNLRNVKAAAEMGINVVHFKSASLLSAHLDKIGIKI